MAFTIVTQEYVDDFVIGASSFAVDFAEKVMDLVVHNDPDAFREEQKLMALQAVIWSLRDLDIETEILSEDEIIFLEEIATGIIQDCPM